jgi:hypothetical protein
MNPDDVTGTGRSRGMLRLLATIATVLLLPPFILLAVLPMMLFLVPVALIGIPFIIPALVSVSLAVRSEERQRASLRPLPRSLKLVQQ